jgi:hypothetical protein
MLADRRAIRPLSLSLGVAAIGCVILIIGVARASNQTAPAGDLAVIESYVIHASAGHLLDGPYSQFGWHHPGPLYFYLQVPFYAVSGQRAAGLSAGALAINLAAVCLVVWVLARSAPLLTVAAVAAALLFFTRAGPIVTSAWNPHILVVPMMAFIVTTAGVANGGVRWLPVSVFLASFLGQTHVGVVPAIAGVFCLALAGMPRERPPVRAIVVAVTASCLVFAVAWLPTILQQVGSARQNLSELWSFFANRQSVRQPFDVAFAAWAEVLSGPFLPDFSSVSQAAVKSRHSSIAQALAVAQVVLVASAGIWSWLTNRRFQARLAALLLAGMAVALWSATRIERSILEYQVFWISAFGMLNAALIVESLVNLSVRSTRSTTRSSLARPACALLIAGCAVVGIWRLNEVRKQSFVETDEMDAIRTVSRNIQTYLRAEAARPVFFIDQAAWDLAAGVFLQLQKADVPFAVEEPWLDMFTTAVAPRGDERLAMTIAGRARHHILSANPGNTVVAARNPLFADASPLTTIDERSLPGPADATYQR